MPQANFCQGCGKPLSAQLDTGLPNDPPSDPPNDPSAQQKPAPSPPQHLCFRCSAPLPANAKICEKCGLNVENLLKPPPQAHARKTADLAEITFFSRPPPADPQMAAFKTYAGWLIAILLAFFASSAAYSWLESSNVISRLIGGDTRNAQAQKFPLGAAEPREDSIANFKTELAGTGGENNDISEDPDKQEAATNSASADADVSKSVEDGPIASRKLQPEVEPAKPATRAKVKAPVESAGQDSSTIERANLQSPEEISADSDQAFASETIPEPDAEQREEAASMDAERQMPAAQPAAKKRVTVTQIEPTNRQRATPASEIEAFFRRLKKSVKQGVSDPPCTQQQKVLNQCY